MDHQLHLVVCLLHLHLVFDVWEWETFYSQENEKDDVFEIKGMKVFMEKAHAIYLLGIEIDWMEGLNNRGFTFNNPNAKDTCGCGTSFSA